MLIYFRALTLSERIEQNSKNSSKPPSSDNPYDKNPKKRKASDKDGKNSSSEDTDETGDSSADKPSDSDSIGPERKPGKQPGAKGFQRSDTPVPENTRPHHPEFCAACCREITVPEGITPYMGHYVFELEKTSSGIRIFCTPHHYYIIACDCGYEN